MCSGDLLGSYTSRHDSIVTFFPSAHLVLERSPIEEEEEEKGDLESLSNEFIIHKYTSQDIPFQHVNKPHTRPPMLLGLASHQRRTHLVRR
jgi:hypothetical protein